MDLGDNIIAASENMLQTDMEYLREIMLDGISLPETATYFNSGVLLIDTEK